MTIPAQQGSEPTPTPDTSGHNAADADADVLEFFEGLDAGEGGEENQPEPAPAPAPAAGPDDLQVPEDTQLAQTWGRLQEVKRRQDVREQAIRQQEEKLAELAKVADDPVGAFRAGLVAKYGEEGAQAALERFVLHQISESIPELKDQLPADLKFSSEVSATQAKVAELERKLAERDQAEAERQKQAEVQAKLETAKGHLRDWWTREGAKAHPHLALEDDPVGDIVDYMAANPKVDIATAVKQLEELGAKKAQKYRGLFVPEDDAAPRRAAPAAAPAPRRAATPTPLTGAPSGAGRKRFEDMSDEESARAIAEALERGETFD